MNKVVPVPVAMPRPLRPGDLIRFVSPASSPKRGDVERSANMLRTQGFRVDFGAHAFGKLNYLSGTDEERLSDLNQALRDPEVRAIFATTGGKGSYRIADRLDFEAARRDPKFLVGYSDITILHLALWKNGVGGAIHGAPGQDDALLHALLTRNDPVELTPSSRESTAALTTVGTAEGPLVGGNLAMVATAAGWALPRLTGCILLLEAPGEWLGQIDRPLTMLRKAGHLHGLAGVAVGQFINFSRNGTWSDVDLLRHHLEPLGVPILGGLPLGHGKSARPVPLGCRTLLDADRRRLTVCRE